MEVASYAEFTIVDRDWAARRLHVITCWSSLHTVETEAAAGACTG